MEKVRRDPASLSQLVKDFDLEVVYKGLDYDTRMITIPDVNRPALQLVGFYDYFEPKRLQILGKAEFTFLKAMPLEQRRKVFEDLLRVFQIDLLREGQHGLLLLLGERGKIGACLRRGLCFRDEIRFLFDLRLRLRVQIRRQGELGNVFVHNLFLLYLFVTFMQNTFCSSALRWPSFAPSRGYRR